MARHPTARKIQRKAPAADDVFVERVLETSVWAKENSRRLVIGGILLAILLLGFLYYRSYTTRLRDTAESQLTQIRPALASGNAALAVRDLETFVARFGGTPAASEARLLLAQAYLETGQAQPALEQVQSIAGDVDNSMGVSAAFLEAGAHEALAQHDAAVQTYVRIADGARYDFQKARALDAAARVRFEQGNALAAVQFYDRLLNLLPDDNQDRPIYELRRAEAAARAQTPQS